MENITIVQAETMEEVLEVALERSIFARKASSEEGSKEKYEDPQPQDVSQKDQPDSPGVH